MVNSLNTKVTYTTKATSYLRLSSYGNVVVGNNAFEFYNEKNPNDFIQIPWNEIDHISASVIFNKWISRFAIFTKHNGHFTFSTRNNKKTLQEVKKYFDENKMLRSMSIWGFIKSKFKKK
ncbi:DUF956 family protein [Helcococcus ovis]|uniref:DUF956 family protein n=1 Tax=Helcococcus ovis TaxID=72026 RepID=UPI00106FA367|nr:DUF956 family protein [Helcococcus ovis]TFF66822.1 DUF956 family protein [Helcococcus ovis]WNZ01048.1 DUF956 family protein [Helcococcus ovis]